MSQLLAFQIGVKETKSFGVFEKVRDAIAPPDERRSALLSGGAPGSAALGVRRAHVDAP
jgi:hypothetical protein